MKVFSKKKFFEITTNCEIYCKNDDVRRRVDAADGKPVVGGMWNGWVIPDSWTENVYNPVEETGKILNTYFPGASLNHPRRLSTADARPCSKIRQSIPATRLSLSALEIPRLHECM